MPFIGRQPTIGNFQVCDAISVVDAQAAYTMQVGGVNVSPESANHMLVSLNGILQAPTSSFTVSGSTITFASALETGDVIDFIQILGNVLDLGVPSDSTVTLAKLTATGTKDATTFLRGDNTFGVPPLGGITMADQWRLLTNKANVDTGDTVFDSNLERIDTSGQGTIGSAMTESSGVFTFPSTGIYWVHAFTSYAKNADRRYCGLNIKLTTNNSSYADIATGWGHIVVVASDDTFTNVTANSFVDVTDTTNVKVKFSGATVSGQAITAIGDTTKNTTTFTFIRLGDT
jgi:hypothetical protein